MFRIEFDTDNAAFGDYAEHEVARILRGLADSLMFSGVGDKDAGRVRDANGNTVGEWEYNGEESLPYVVDADR